MPTLHKRLKQFLFTNKKYPELTQEQKMKLGRIVCDKYISQKEIKLPLHKATYESDEGTFTVVAYPKKFRSEIDKAIKEFYNAQFPQPLKTKKEVRVKNPVYSAKKSY